MYHSRRSVGTNQRPLLDLRTASPIYSVHKPQQDLEGQQSALHDTPTKACESLERETMPPSVPPFHCRLASPLVHCFIHAFHPSYPGSYPIINNVPSSSEHATQLDRAQAFCIIATSAGSHSVVHRCPLRRRKRLVGDGGTEREKSLSSVGTFCGWTGASQAKVDGYGVPSAENFRLMPFGHNFRIGDQQCGCGTSTKGPYGPYQRCLRSKYTLSSPVKCRDTPSGVQLFYSCTV